ncbi:MAG: hypothetical protein ABFC62_08285 [Clostridiaceae bacterium]|nr:hypothetical protein [Eubacteriales bacterium]
METPGRWLPYEKSIVINALYDTIEALGLHLDSSDSARGTLIVSDARRTERMRIHLDAATEAQTRVSVFSENADRDASDTWSSVIFDELSGTIRRASAIGCRKLTKERDAL